ncbi:MAG TPA: ABC transporter substrate-binding protein [Kiritimatiellia bacterium]|nr:ABC transporter substrate-binding protein [Kiritimatiellia bacterium]
MLASACSSRETTSAGNRDDALHLVTQRIRGFDPARAADVSSSMAIARIYETLVEYDYHERPYRLQPLLAEKMPEVSEDGLTYRFRLRSGIFFSDDPCFAETGGEGRELVAGDVVYSIKRIADRKNASTGWWAFRSRIAGLDAFREASEGDGPTDYDLEVEGLRALDRYTVEITLVKPYPQLMWILAMTYAAVVPREAVEHYGAAFNHRPVGTGPFRLASWRRNYRLEYHRNPAWERSGREPVGLNRMVDLVVADPATRWMMFLNRQLHLTGVTRDQWESVVRPDFSLAPSFVERGIRLEVNPSLRINYIAFNMDDPVVGPNRALRQAMTSAFNTAEWLTLHNHAVVRPPGPIPAGLAGYDPEAERFPFDLDRAREWLAEAGYPGGRDPQTGRRLSLTLEFGRADDQELRQAAELIQQFMARIGIELNLVFQHGPAFFERLERRQAQMFYLGWIGDYPDAENFLQLFYGPNVSPGSNRCNYRNEDYDRLFEQARILPDGPERTELYRRLAAIIIEDSPWILASQPMDVVLVQGVEGYRSHSFPYGMEKHLRLSGGGDR